VGLGNPGPEYARNRHNVGFMVVDEVARRAGGHFSRSKFRGEVTSVNIEGNPVTILKPATYMNLSGDAVVMAASYLRISPAHIVVVHDDVDIPFGRIKVKSGGGHGGHNGLRSVSARLGSGDYHRVRVGVGRPTHGEDVADYVLSNFSSDESFQLHDIIEGAAAAAVSVITYGPETTMNKFNGLRTTSKL